jgi:magnesium-protoporphyrin O-methyltransferase
MLAAMRVVGRLLPRNDRSPSIVPVTEKLLRKELIENLPGWTIGRDLRVSTNFYKSHSIELCAPGMQRA